MRSDDQGYERMAGWTLPGDLASSVAWRRRLKSPSYRLAAG